MNKKLKITFIVVGIVLLTALLYFTVLHPRVKTYLMTAAIYKEFGGTRDIGLPIVEYDQASVTDDSLIMTDFGTFSLGIPSDLEDQSKEDSDFIIYYTIGADRETGVHNPDAESIGFKPVGNDNSSMALVNNPDFYEESGISDAEARHITNGFEKLGYGMPDNAYATLKCAYSLTSEDYNFLNYEKSLAFAYALAYRAGSLYYSNGDTAKTYYYESEGKYALINEEYRPDYDGNYHFNVSFYDPDDLNTEYLFSMTVHDKETGYAIINSLTFD